MDNKEMDLAWQYIQGTQISVFLTGKAGTGKTTFLRRLREKSPKRMVVLAPTGVAAINANGQTIHSFFQLPLSPYIPGLQRDDQKFFRMSKEKKNLIRTMDLLVIDEISMVRVDVLDAIDNLLRRYRNHSLPFGGVQLLLIGDLQQLSPVAKEDEWQMLSRHYQTPYFFSSHALSQLPYVTIELQHIYRQQNDELFINILASIRNNDINAKTIKSLNSRYIPNFKEPDNEDWIRLTTHNRSAQQYNEMKLSLLTSPLHSFRAKIDGNFPEYSYPTDENLQLKVGSQVMFIKNDLSPEHRYYNGKIGKITAINDNGIHVRCKGDYEEIIVKEMTWENMKYSIDENTKEITEKVDGTFSQVPLKLAWAITVHKSQGLTFEHAVIDINNSFAHGQAYVALSRCRSLNGMVLTNPLSLSSIITDSSVNSFINQATARGAESERELPEMKIKYFIFLLNELYSFTNVYDDMLHLHRTACNTIYNVSPSLIERLHTALPIISNDVIDVAKKFATQYTSMVLSAGKDYATNSFIQERLKKGAEYFYKKLDTIISPILRDTSLHIENKQHKKQFTIAVDALNLSYVIKKETLLELTRNGFSISSYLQSKAKAALMADETPEEKRKREKRQKKQQNDEYLKQLMTESQAHNATEVSHESKKEERQKAEKEPKKKKGDTYNLTLKMYKSGLSIKEIAEMRKLSPSTIENHISRFVADGTIALRDIVSLSDEIIIRSELANHQGAYTLSEIKESLPPHISYMQIRSIVALNAKK